MKRFFLFIVIMLTAAMTSRPQQICPNVSMLFNKQRQLYPQEKLFIHTDRTSYMPGERIWLCIYAVDATSLIPTDADMYAYAELLDTQGFTIKRIKIARHNGAYAGYLDTPKDLAEEQCFLRCYTLYSAGLHGYECLTPISIGSSPAPVTDIQTADAWEKSNPLHCTDTGQAFKIMLDNSAAKAVKLAVISRGCVCYDGQIKPGEPIVFPKKELPEGISQFIAIDSAGAVFGIKSVFSPYGKESVKATITAHAEFSDSIRLNICLPSQISAHMSVAITKGLDNKTPSIIPQILLSQDVRGGVADADRFFTNGYNAAAVDSLLHRSVCDRYCVDSILAGQFTQPPVKHEVSQTISGKAIVTAPYPRDASFAKVSIISPNADMYAVATADKYGNFAISGLDYPDGTTFAVNASVGNQYEKTAVRIDETTYPPVDSASIAVQSGRRCGDAAVFNDIASGRTIRLHNVDVAAARRDKHNGTFSGMADFSMTADQLAYIDATCIHEVLRRIPGIYMKGDTAYVRSKISVYGKSHAAIAIDGVILDGDYDLDIIQMQDVERIDVFKTGSAAIWGAKGGPGVISITLKNGASSLDGMTLNRVSRFKPLGYQKPEHVHSSENAKSMILYWNGNVRLCNGNATITIPKSSLPRGSAFTVQAEGVSDDGILLHGIAHLEF